MAKKRHGYYQRKLQASRRIWNQSSPVRKLCLKNAKIKGNDGLDKWICYSCRNLYALSEVDVDHIRPIENTIPQTVDELLICEKRLECPLEGLQILCRKVCHKMKTDHESHERKKADLVKKLFGHLGCINYSLDDNKNLQDMKVLLKLNYAIKMIEKSKGDKKTEYIAKFTKLLEKYL